MNDSISVFGLFANRPGTKSPCDDRIKDKNSLDDRIHGGLAGQPASFGGPGAAPQVSGIRYQVSGISTAIRKASMRKACKHYSLALNVADNYRPPLEIS